jgi:adenylate kinase family enzyme
MAQHECDDKSFDLIIKYPLIAIDIAAVDRASVFNKLQAIAAALHRPIFTWSMFAAGFQPLERIESTGFDPHPAAEIVKLLGSLHDNPQGLYIFEDLFATIDTCPPIDRERVYQAISRLFAALNQSERNCSAIFIESGRGEIPVFLRQIIWDYEFPLPTEIEVNALLLAQGIDLTQSSRLSNILAGLTAEEIKIGIRAHREITDLQEFGDRLLAYKYQLLATFGLEFIGDTTTQDIGGLDRLKAALEHVRLDFTPAARAFNLPLPRGWLLVGVPGAGKTYFAKICAQKLGFPLIDIRIDVAKSGGIKKFKQLLARIDSCEPCIPYFDEFDKFFMGENSGEFLGVILTWLNEKTSKTFVLGTLNRLENLPPELTRAGRFDKVFYVDFPNDFERKQILQLHCARFDKAYQDLEHGRLTPAQWLTIIESTNKYTGAELAQVAINAAKNQFYASLHNPTAQGQTTIEIGIESLLAARKEVNSLYKRDPEGVLAIENRAKAFAEAASSYTPSPFELPDIDIYA